MLDVDALSTMIADIVSEEVGKAVAPLRAKIVELEARPAGAFMDDVKAVAEVMISDAFVVRAPKGGAECVDPAQVALLVAQEVERAVAALPAPQGGKDAAGIVEALKDSGELVLTLADGRLIRTGIRDGEKGEPGKDGFSLQDFDVQKEDDGRTLVLSFDAGEIRHEYAITMPHMAYCGVYKAEQEYMIGDVVTWGGSAWHCNEPTKEKPDSGPWQLMVKKGRDGRDAKPNG